MVVPFEAKEYPGSSLSHFSPPTSDDQGSRAFFERLYSHCSHDPQGEATDSQPGPRATAFRSHPRWRISEETYGAGSLMEQPSDNIWYPEAADLRLLHVPEEARKRVRERLAPWLLRLSHTGQGQRIGVKIGECYRVAQALVMTAEDPGVRYVEGAWVHPKRLKEKGEQPQPHAWTTVDGQRVDLIGEFDCWRNEETNDERLYKTIGRNKEFSHENLSAKFKSLGYDMEKKSSFSIVAEPWIKLNLCDERIVFKDEINFLIEQCRNLQTT